MSDDKKKDFMDLTIEALEKEPPINLKPGAINRLATKQEIERAGYIKDVRRKPTLENLDQLIYADIDDWVLPDGVSQDKLLIHIMEFIGNHASNLCGNCNDYFGDEYATDDYCQNCYEHICAQDDPREER